MQQSRKNVSSYDPLVDVQKKRQECERLHAVIKVKSDKILWLSNEFLTETFTESLRREFYRGKTVYYHVLADDASSPLLLEVILTAVGEQFDMMIGHFMEAGLEMHKDPSRVFKETLLLMKRFFSFNRMMAEYIEAILNIKYTHPSDLFVQTRDSPAWQLVLHHTYEIEPDCRELCIQEYQQKMWQAMAAISSIGRAASRIPKTAHQMERVIEQFASIPDKVNAGPIEFEDFIDYGSRENADSFNPKFFARMMRYSADKRKCHVDGNFMIAQADFKIFKKFLNLADKSTVRYFRAKLEYPSIEHNHKFYFPPNFLDRFFVKSETRPLILATNTIVLASHELLPVHMTEDRKDFFRVRFFCDIKIKHLSRRIDSIKAKRYGRKTPIRENFCFDYSQFEDPVQENGMIIPGAQSARDPTVRITSSAKVIKQWLPEDKTSAFDVFLIHIHGGGFAAMSSSSHQNYLRLWPKELKIPVFSIDYRLAPDAQYPHLFNDVIRSYIWILAFVYEVLRVNPKKIILSGDSAGGNLAASLTTWCVENNVRQPDHLILHYLPSDLNFKRFTPSLVHVFSDFLLNYSALRMCISYYMPHWANPLQDYYLSPIVTPANILARFPPTSVFCCERDPLCDDSFRYARRLLEAGVPTKIYYFRHASHGLLNFAIDNPYGMRHAIKYELSTRELIRSLAAAYLTV